MFLTSEELRELTGRSQTRAQIAALNMMGIEHRLRPDGKVVVLKEHVARVLGGEQSKPKSRREPNWEAINA